MTVAFKALRLTSHTIFGNRTSWQPKLCLLLFCMFFSCASTGALAESTAEAQSFFQKYQNLSLNNDPKLADLYSDNATISNTRYYPNGQQKELRWTGAQFKTLIASSAKLAKAQNDKDTFSKITYTPAGRDSVEIKAMRHSERKNYDSWFLQTISKLGSKWQITREQSQSRP